MSNQTSEIPEQATYEICADSNKGKVRQLVKCPDLPKPRWEVAAKMHADHAVRIDRAELQRANRRAKRA